MRDDLLEEVVRSQQVTDCFVGLGAVVFTDYLRDVAAGKNGSLAAAALRPAGHAHAGVRWYEQCAVSLLPPGIGQPGLATCQCKQCGRMRSGKWVGGWVICSKANAIQKYHQNVHQDGGVVRLDNNCGASA